MGIAAGDLLEVMSLPAYSLGKAVQKPGASFTDSGVARNNVAGHCAVGTFKPDRKEETMDERPILMERDKSHRVITLNRPQRLNAFTEAMHQALKAALAEVEADNDCRALILTGAGRGFCSGHARIHAEAKPAFTGRRN